LEVRSGRAIKKQKELQLRQLAKAKDKEINKVIMNILAN
jgi:hypothetical protein